MEINNNNNKNPLTPSLWAEEEQWAPNRICKGVHPYFWKFFVPFFCASLFSVRAPSKREGQDATWTLSRTLWQSGRGKRGVKRGACGGGGGGEKGVKVAWCLPLICHEDGRHIMTANVEQIGLVEEGRNRERRQMAKLAWCQRYQDMTMHGKLPPVYTLVAACLYATGSVDIENCYKALCTH